MCGRSLIFEWTVMRAQRVKGLDSLSSRLTFQPRRPWHTGEGWHDGLEFIKVSLADIYEALITQCPTITHTPLRI